MYFVYSTLWTVGFLLSAPYWLYRGVRDRKYLPSLRQRFGFKIPHPLQRPLWIHAVSVGEVLAARSLIAGLRCAQPDIPVAISTVTATGQRLAQQEFGKYASVFYFPFDWKFSAGRFLDALKPRAVLIMETEIWPNFLHACARRRIPVFVANGRISDKSLKRYRMVRRFMTPVLRGIAMIGTQTAADRERFLEIGANPERVRVTGNLKYDFPDLDLGSSPPWLETIRASLTLDSERPAIVIGSTMKGEEALFFEAFRRVRQSIPNARLIMAPRHPERFDEVAELLEQSGIPFARRSALGNGRQRACEVLLLDTIGELRAVYALADVAVIGGSFLPFGGHNPLEPAALGKAIVFGPHMSNFRDIAAVFLQENAAHQCSLEALPDTLIELLRNRDAGKRLGLSAAATFRRNQGATQKTVNLISPYIESETQ